MSKSNAQEYTMSRNDWVALKQTLDIARVICAEGVQGLRDHPELREWDFAEKEQPEMIAKE